MGVAVTRSIQMEAAVAQDCREVTVRAVRIASRSGDVFYASVPENSAASAGCQTSRAETRRRLVTILWEHLRAKKSPSWNSPCFSNGAELPIQIAHDALGRPHLLLGEHRGPAISFSTAGEEVWAAICGDGLGIGIDVAGNAEFQEGYPLHRAFHEQELRHALESAGGDVPKAAALLWSVKEAVVKALGCAFHLVDPLDIHVRPSAGEGFRHAFSVRLSGKARTRFPAANRQPITVRSLAQTETWLSIAALNWDHREGPSRYFGNDMLSGKREPL